MIIRKKDIHKMSEKDREEKLKELKMELIKSKVASSKGGKIKIKEIKKTIARIITINRLTKNPVDKK